MTSFLALCAKVALRSGAIGAAPPSVLNQTGRQAKCVDWTQSAWEDIQNMHAHWSFLMAEFQGSIDENNDTYAPVSLGISTRFGGWIGDGESRYYGRNRPITFYDPDQGSDYEAPLTEISFDAWRSRYNRGRQYPGPPLYYAIAPDQTLRFGPAPDKEYTVRGIYRKAPQILATNDEEPDMPSAHHMIIVDRAIIMIDEFDEAPAALTGAMRSFSNKLAALRRDCLPDITAGGL